VKIIKTRIDGLRRIYYLQENGQKLNDIRFIQYADDTGIYTVNKKNGDYFTFLPPNNSYMSLAKIIEKGYVVLLID
jgi:hypothetical protein